MAAWYTPPLFLRAPAAWELVLLSRCPIRYKLLISVALLFLIVAVLSVSGLVGVNAYRDLVRMVSARAAELPLADELSQSVAELRIDFGLRPSLEVGHITTSKWLVREQTLAGVARVRESLRRYQAQLEQNIQFSDGEDDAWEERDTVRRIEVTLANIEELCESEDWVMQVYPNQRLYEELNDLHESVSSLPEHLQTRMLDLKGSARGEYRLLLFMAWLTSILAAVMLLVLIKLFRAWIVKPLNVLIHGSQRVAEGEFDHRIQLTSHDEMAKLAKALNDMTTRFCEIRDDLNQQVRQRTKEVVRSEQLASVGFLAANVAHEINNPLASIAWSAESLEERLHDIIYDDDLKSDEEHNPEITELRNYLRRIQEEAFRCKGITERLLDYSRIGDIERQPADLGQLARDVIDLVQHLGSYKNKRIDFESRDAVRALVNPAEIKQIILNLLTNALDSLDAGGAVQVELSAAGKLAHLVVRDNGCGMTAEVLEHLFEPFFTRRRDGHGTGLGLSITYQIVTDHGGTIEARSDGPGTGSQFHVTLPLASQNDEEEHQRRSVAA